VAFDRVVTLRNAEKLIRQGKLEAGIAEYVRIVEDAPGDWNAKNILGDLYARVGKTDKAVEQFGEIANNLIEEGSTAKAGALYKKILKLKPDNEQALIQVAEILKNQGLYADARAHLNALVELRRTKGDARGALQAKIRLGSLDPDDYDGRRAAASARIELGDVGGAFEELKTIAGELTEKGRLAEAVAVLREAAKLNPDDEEVRERLVDAHFEARELAQAREHAATVDQFRRIAAAFQAEGAADEALETLRRAASLNAHDAGLRAELARKFVERGDLAAAAEYLSDETAGDDPALLMTIADIRLRTDRVDDGIVILRGLLEQDVAARDQVVQLASTFAPQPDIGFRVIELTAEAAVAKNDWDTAAADLQGFVARAPNYIPALMRLVEICVDGGLDKMMYTAQAELADAYLANGAAMEARFIAEDLVAREPWERANVDRFRRALELLGEPDPDAIIAERLSEETSLTPDDLFASVPAAEDPEEVAPARPVLAVEELIALEAEAETPPKTPASRRQTSDDRQFQLSANAIELDSIFADFEEAPLPPPGASEESEVDLSVVLEDIKPNAQATPADSAPAKDLDGVFGNLRDQAARRTDWEEAEKEYKRGLALRAAGDIDGCIRSLEKASRSPKLRFATSWLIARLYRDRGRMPEALEWLERAAQAPAASADDAHQLLYELADGLEKEGETARALAVLLELHADAGSYNDIDERIDRLTKVQTRG
jgi:tetratricopeptide (TPR) repeat protein